MTFDRITIDLAAMAVRRASEACAVATVVAMIEDGMSPEEILDDLPYLERADIHEIAAVRLEQASGLRARSALDI